MQAILTPRSAHPLLVSLGLLGGSAGLVFRFRRGSQSSLQALYVGAAIEEIDMIDLQEAIDATDNADIQMLYENLMSGSRNHLRAYVAQIENLGVVYEAQYLPQDEVDSIVDSPVERGHR